MVLLPSHSFTQWGQLGEILGGVQTREQRQLPFSSCLGSGKKRRKGASIKISKAGAALRKQSRPVAEGESYESKH